MVAGCGQKYARVVSRKRSCKVRYQTREHTCGPTAVQNLLRCYGIKKSIDALAELCETDIEGTDEDGLKACFRDLGYRYVELSTNSRLEAAIWLRSTTEEGVAIVACVDHYEHWVCICRGPTRDRVLLIDGGHATFNRQENGVHSLKHETALNRIRAAKHLGVRYYALAVII